jgi:hypothetical protein
MRVLTLLVSTVMSALTEAGSPGLYSMMPLVTSNTPVTFVIIMCLTVNPETVWAVSMTQVSAAAIPGRPRLRVSTATNTAMARFMDGPLSMGVERR